MDLPPKEPFVPSWTNPEPGSRGLPRLRDGLSLLPHFKGESAPSSEERGTVFWQLDLYKKLQRHYPKPKPFATEVAMKGKWKLLALNGNPVELLDLESDPNERRNVIADHPDLVASLTAQLNRWLDSPRKSK